MPANERVCSLALVSCLLAGTLWCGVSSVLADIGAGLSPTFSMQLATGPDTPGIGEVVSSTFSLSLLPQGETALSEAISTTFALANNHVDGDWVESALFRVDTRSPLADAGDYARGYESRGSEAYVCLLDGMASQGDWTYLWEQIAGVPVELDDPTIATPHFDAAQWDGSTELTRNEATLRFRLTINKGRANEATDEVEVYIRIPGDANGDDAVNAFDVAKLRLSDPDADFSGDGIVNAMDIGILRQNATRRRTVE